MHSHPHKQTNPHLNSNNQNQQHIPHTNNQNTANVHDPQCYFHNQPISALNAISHSIQNNNKYNNLYLYPYISTNAPTPNKLYSTPQQHYSSTTTMTTRPSPTSPLRPKSTHTHSSTTSPTKKNYCSPRTTPIYNQLSTPSLHTTTTIHQPLYSCEHYTTSQIRTTTSSTN